ncbi:MAG TPA: NAD-dependent deacylase [Bryobacteraceae bacterium]|nr:NAD-dependent deacylase [Bryobacteraceae bacterium]
MPSGRNQPIRLSRQGRPASGNIVILTGAGISRESGLHTFRDADGIWATVSVDDVATPRAFLRNPVRVHDFYNARRRALLSGTIRPNEAHFALANLQRAWTGSVHIVTQNIDDLHERAGSVDVIHMHGELLKARCSRCQTVVRCVDDLSTQTNCPSCEASAGMRPDVVWFGEMPMHLDKIQQALEEADLFLSIGTSGTVYPAAGFVEIARNRGIYTAELNLEGSANASIFDEAFYGPATVVVTQYVQELLGAAE